MLLHPLTNFEIQKHQNEPRFNVVYSRDNLPKNKGWCLIYNKSWWIWLLWIALDYRNAEIIYFDSFGVEGVPKEIKKLIGNEIIITNIFTVQSNNSITCRYFCIGFIDFVCG